MNSTLAACNVKPSNPEDYNDLASMRLARSSLWL